ncbi:MAG: GerMN domain-containing protein [Fusobacteriaceae bacterium]
MKKSLIVILTLVLAGTTFYSGMSHFLLEQESREVREIVIEEKDSSEKMSEVEKIKRIMYVPNKSLSSLKKIEVEFDVEEERDRLVKKIYNEFFSKVKEVKSDFSKPELINIYWSERELYLNIEKSDSLTSESDVTLVILYGITNSISEIGEVNKIKFLIDGKEAGGIFSSYYERNLKI